ncbi:MAG: 50S ribosomal protein L29 [Candidatus Levybacteria bacterium RIFCSPHIGHO2_02_FULL_37_13]|nr:MAG: 50S ribosomal protein L29 [Candidatus Levybacteria bacterium RIFCSPHIGHO2_02_FULL_37_13]OGH30454.1 MAG: 50S ribosomal protein L29 [Candidatus Levybacteria bacterium RIFCSPHIGHO2_12_FULL_37_9]OGH40017.1 MAG: 50S ribosomal protein L29 [Candidatus Levybacteria bacterium RIFCSPLOWO2_01_FULL_37_26]
MKTKEKLAFRSKTLVELKTLLREGKNALYLLKIELSQNKLKNLRSIFLKRKEMAIIATIINEKEFKDVKNT